MTRTDPPHPGCFGDIEEVFPKGKDGLRNSPDKCVACVFKVACIQTAMQGNDGLMIQEERIDRAYAAGLISFFERWSKKKALRQKIGRNIPDE